MYHRNATQQAPSITLPQHAVTCAALHTEVELVERNTTWAQGVFNRIPGLPKTPEQRGAVYAQLSRVRQSRHRFYPEYQYLPSDKLFAEPSLSFLKRGQLQSLFFSSFTSVAVKCAVQGVCADARVLTDDALDFLEAFEVMYAGTPNCPFYAERKWRVSDGHGFKVYLEMSVLLAGATELEFTHPDAAHCLRSLARRLVAQGHRESFIVERISPKATDPYGRCYGRSKLPMGTMPKEARVWVMRAYCAATGREVVELDAESCHLRLLESFLAGAGYDTTDLTSLLTRKSELRAGYADELGVSQEVVKSILLASMYGASVDGPSTKQALPVASRDAWKGSACRAMVKAISSAQTAACALLGIEQVEGWRTQFALHMQREETRGMRAALRTMQPDFLKVVSNDREVAPVLWLHDALFVSIPAGSSSASVCDSMREAAAAEGVDMMFAEKVRWAA